MPKKDRLQGTLDLLILKTLTQGPMHGFGVTMHIEGVSGGVLHLEEGSLYPALQRMQVKGYISAEWGVSENKRRARFYRLSPKGQQQLDREVESFDRVMEAIAHVMLPG